MAFGPVNTGGRASGSTLEDIYEGISQVRSETKEAIQAARKDAAEALAAHTGAVNPHGITAENVGAVPVDRTVNGKALSEDISLTAQDVGAAAGNHTHTLSSLGAASADHSHSFADLSGKVFHAGTTAPDNKGLLWIDTTANTGGLKYHNGSAWVHVPVSST